MTGPNATQTQPSVACALPAPVPNIYSEISKKEISERLGATLSAVHTGKNAIETLAPETKKLICEIQRDLNANKIDAEKVKLLVAYASMTAETFDPTNKKHQEMVKEVSLGLAHILLQQQSSGDLVTSQNKGAEHSKTVELLRSASGMYFSLYKDKDNLAADLTAAGKGLGSSQIAPFVAKIKEFENKTETELLVVAKDALTRIQIRAKDGNFETTNQAYQNLSAAYYKLKENPEYKEILKEALVAFAKGGENKECLQSAAIFLAHTSWDKLSPEQLNSVYKSANRDLILPFVAILTNVVPEKASNPVDSKKGWNAFVELKRKPDGKLDLQPSDNSVADSVLSQRLKLLNK